MFDSLITSIENAFVQFSFRRLLYIVFLISVVGAALYVYNELTGYTTFTRVARRLSALERLQQLEQAGIRESPELAPIYQSLVAELRDQPRRPFTFAFEPDPLLKFLAAALIPTAFALWGAIQMLKGKPEGPSLFTGAVVMTLVLGVPGVMLPTWRSIWLNVAVYAVVQIVLLTLLTWYGARPVKSTAARAP